MNLETSPDQAKSFVDVAAPAQRFLSSFDQIVLRHLKGQAEIESVMHLRDEIDLSVHAAAGLQFMALEKKEMSADLYSRSILLGNA